MHYESFSKNKNCDQKDVPFVILNEYIELEKFFEVDIAEIMKNLSKSGFTKEEIIINPDLSEGKSKNMKKDK